MANPIDPQDQTVVDNVPCQALVTCRVLQTNDGDASGNDSFLAHDVNPIGCEFRNHVECRS